MSLVGLGRDSLSCSRSQLVCFLCSSCCWLLESADFSTSSVRKETLLPGI